MPEALPNNAIKEELESFATSILTNSPVKVDLEDGLNALKLAYQIEHQIQDSIFNEGGLKLNV